jgi:hypothetical protein
MVPGSNLGSPSDAGFTVTGQPGWAFAYTTSILIPAVEQGLTLTGIVPPSGTGSLDGSGPTAGTASLFLGATISDDGTAPSGFFYAGQVFRVTVSYQ